LTITPHLRKRPTTIQLLVPATRHSDGDTARAFRWATLLLSPEGSSRAVARRECSYPCNSGAPAVIFPRPRRAPTLVRASERRRVQASDARPGRGAGAQVETAVPRTETVLRVRSVDASLTVGEDEKHYRLRTAPRRQITPAARAATAPRLDLREPCQPTCAGDDADAGRLVDDSLTEPRRNVTKPGQCRVARRPAQSAYLQGESGPRRPL
jgi:hypothetical protein